MAKDDRYYIVKGGVVQSVTKATADAVMGGVGKLARLCKEGFTVFEAKSK